MVKSSHFQKWKNAGGPGSQDVTKGPKGQGGGESPELQERPGADTRAAVGQPRGLQHHPG